MCMGALPLMKKAGVNPMWAVSPGLALLSKSKGKKKAPERYAEPTSVTTVSGG
jgi:hypothetical protein